MDASGSLSNVIFPSVQCDEIEALTAIYGDDFSVFDEYQSRYSIKVTVDHLSLNLLVSI